MSERKRRFDAVIRVSRVKGREGDAFMSPVEQRDAIERRAAADGVVIAEWWDELDVSGGSIDREGLQAALGRAVAGKVDGILVAKIDRFARTVQGGLSAINTLEDAGKELWSAREGVIVGDARATATDKLIRTFFLMLAQWQRDTLTEGWEAVRHRHIANGVHTAEPYGYRKDLQVGPDGRVIGGTRRLVAHPNESPWVRPIFEMRAAGETYQAIASWLHEQGAPTREGGPWNAGSVRHIIRCRAYLGEIASGEIVNKSAHEPLVAVELWEHANSMHKTPKRRKAGQFPLSGILRCAGCGVRMSGRTNRMPAADGSEREYRYYTCRGTHNAAQVCPAPARVRADDLEEIVDGAFRERFIDGSGFEASDATAELEAAETDLRTAEDDLSAFLTSEATDELRRTLGQSYVDDGIRARMARVVDAREAIAAARSAAYGITLPADLGDVWDELDSEDRRGFLAEAFAVVAVARGRTPTAGRCRLWTRDDPSAPTGLPGVDGGGLVLAPIQLGIAEPAR